jgi:alkylation response protein AidB-like acyl-CoA dehydrogenase
MSPEERAAFVQAARTLAMEKVAPHALELANTHEYPTELFELLRDAGYFGLWIEPRWGGLGLDLRTLSSIIEELACVSNTLASLVIGQLQGTLPILITGSDEVRDRYVPDLVAGRIRPAMALTEPDAGSDVAGIKTIATRDGDHFVLNGRKAFITGAAVADVITVYAKTRPGRSTSTIQGFLVPADTPGLLLGRTEEKMASSALPTSEVILEDCRVPRDLALGEPGSGFRSAMQVLEHVRPLIAARSVGLARGAFESATSYIGQREAFGAPLASLQALQFKLADMAMGIEAARGLVERACRALDEGDPAANRYCAMAKCFASDTAMAVTIDAVQMFGGYGVMKDYPVEARMREAKIAQIVDGTNEVQRLVIGRSLLNPGDRPRVARDENGTV